jgi:hypothetical protein
MIFMHDGQSLIDLWMEEESLDDDGKDGVRLEKGLTFSQTRLSQRVMWIGTTLAREKENHF